MEVVVILLRRPDDMTEPLRNPVLRVILRDREGLHMYYSIVIVRKVA